MTTKPIGLYVHIPFCVRKCNYCDFCSFPVKSISYRDEYISALCREIKRYKDRNLSLDSIFFGGGTPSLLTKDEMSRIVSAIKESFTILHDVEFTVEANPGTIDEEKLASFVSLGVNRLSIGLQTIHENELKILGRIHSFADFEKAYLSARRAGIKNINVDLMYGIPEQTMVSFEMTLRKIIALSPEHISLYGLILEDGTPFYSKREKLAFPCEDDECDMYYLASNLLRNCGYRHYEISNYAKHGNESRHNLKYWRCDEYIGVGLSAYSYIDGKRFGNTRVADEYLNDSYPGFAYEEIVDGDSLAYEFVMLGLRTADGISLDEYKERFHTDFVCNREDLIKKLVDDGYARVKEGRLFLSEKGFYVSNSILTELI
jgi:oxygen-independent coproporphyrinogen-3 oxidase